MSEPSITVARNRLAAVVNRARKEPVFLTGHGKRIVAVVDADVFEKLVGAWEQLQDIRALDEAANSGESSVTWDHAKSELGL